MNRKKTTKTLILFLLVMFFACSEKDDSEFDKDIVIINYKNADRSEFAKAIHKLSECNAKLIGLNALFVELRDPLQDSLLANEIKAAGNVILATNIGGDSLIRSNKIFSEGSMAEGVVNFSLNEANEIFGYKPFTQIDWSFPVTIVSYFDPVRGKDIIKNTVPNESYPITRFRGQFLIIDIEKLKDINCEAISGKIVLMGYAGPGDEDQIVTTEDSGQGTFTYRTVVLASVISDLLTMNPEKQ